MGEDDEVTFLLKLRPSPTPPTRKRRSSGGWDVSIERNVVVPPSVPPRKSSVTYVKSHQLQLQLPPPQPSAPPQEFVEEAGNWSHRFGQMPYMG